MRDLNRPPRRHTISRPLLYGVCYFGPSQTNGELPLRKMWATL